MCQAGIRISDGGARISLMHSMRRPELHCLAASNFSLKAPQDWTLLEAVDPLAIQAAATTQMYQIHDFAFALFV